MSSVHLSILRHFKWYSQTPSAPVYLINNYILDEVIVSVPNSNENIRAQRKLGYNFLENV